MFIASIPSMLPQLIIWLVGIVFALRERDRYPVRSRLAVIGFLVLLLQGPVFVVVRGAVMNAVRNEPSINSDLGTLFGVVGIAQGIAVVIGGAFLIAALFGPRANTRGVSDDDDFL